MATYQFGAPLDQGAFAEVVELKCLDDGWTGVAKRLKSSCSAEDRLRFEREIRLQAQCIHPNIMRIKATGLGRDRPWFAMERATGNLRRYLTETGAGEKQLLRFIEIGRAVEYAHENGIIHRDLKPENVLIVDDEFFGPTAIVSDFGLGRHVDQATITLTVTNAFVGTFAYAAPEQFTDAHGADKRTDIYALGKILYELLSGQIPFPSMSMDLIDPKFRFIVQKATSDSRDDRFQTVTALLEAVELVTGGRAQLRRPQEAIQDIIDRSAAADAMLDNEADELLRLLLENVTDYTVLVHALPIIPAKLLSYLGKHELSGFLSVLIAYDEQISSGVSFSYCDTIADFYARTFVQIDDHRVRIMILKRLSTLGYENNRWHVGGVFGRLVQGLDDVGLLAELRDWLMQNQEAAAWNRGYVGDIPPMLRDVFRRQ